MVAGENGIVYAVNDSFYGYQPTIFTIDTTVTPAQITDALPLTREGMAAQKLDLEGITLIDGTLWMAVQREWGAVHYPKAGADTGWTGLSEIVAHDGNVYVIERDNQIGDMTELKKIYRVSVDQMVAAPLGGPLRVVTKEEVRDLIPDLKSNNGYVVDDSSGETFFWSIGQI